MVDSTCILRDEKINMDVAFKNGISEVMVAEKVKVNLNKLIFF